MKRTIIHSIFALSHSIFFLLFTTSLLSKTGLRKEKWQQLLFLLFSCMMTISQDIFNICITYIVYEVRRKGIIYSKTYFFSLFTPCLGIKSQSNKSRKRKLFFFLPKCPIVFKHSRLLCFCYV